jgi:hypothetical protein
MECWTTLTGLGDATVSHRRLHVSPNHSLGSIFTARGPENKHAPAVV